MATSDAFPQYASLVRPEIERALAAYTEFSDDCPKELREAIRYSLLAPGKRLRPMLVLMACEACGSDRKAALPAACAVEMIHTYSLVHDDLPAMDDDDLRRGRPTCHKVFGEANAILTGDALLALAFEVLATGVRPPEVAARCCGELARAAGPEALVAGQCEDLSAEHAQIDFDRLERIHRRKTGAMFRVSLRLGAIIAGADETQFWALDRYGQRLGLAFQIVDDLLDCRGDEAALGKRTKKDSDRGKLTFPGCIGVEASTERAERLVDEACTAAALFGARGTGLEALARYVLERNQ